MQIELLYTVECWVLWREGVAPHPPRHQSSHTYQSRDSIGGFKFSVGPHMNPRKVFEPLGKNLIENNWNFFLMRITQKEKSANFKMI